MIKLITKRRRDLKVYHVTGSIQHHCSSNNVLPLFASILVTLTMPYDQENMIIKQTHELVLEARLGTYLDVYFPHMQMGFPLNLIFKNHCNCSTEI